MISFAMLAMAFSLGIYLTHNRAKPKPAKPSSSRQCGYRPVMAHETVNWQAKRLVPQR